MAQKDQLPKVEQDFLQGLLEQATPVATPTVETPVQQEGLIKDWLEKEIQTAIVAAKVSPANRASVEDAVLAAALGGKLGSGAPSERTADAIRSMVREIGSAQAPEASGEELEPDLELDLPPEPVKKEEPPKEEPPKEVDPTKVADPSAPGVEAPKDTLAAVLGAGDNAPWKRVGEETFKSGQEVLVTEQVGKFFVGIVRAFEPGFIVVEDTVGELRKVPLGYVTTPDCPESILEQAMGGDVAGAIASLIRE